MTLRHDAVPQSPFWEDRANRGKMQGVTESKSELNRLAGTSARHDGTDALNGL